MNNNYNDFIKSKIIKFEYTGFDIELDDINPVLFDFQKSIIKWAIRNGKSAVFASTGLGKTLIQLEIANIINKTKNVNVIIFAPLAVSEQTIREAKEKLNLNINNLRYGFKEGINIINYEQIENVEVDKFDCIILDESSILKNFTGKYRNLIIEKFKKYSYKFCFTATPSPNDYMELGNHSEFLDVLQYKHMLSTFFFNDAGDTKKWLIKPHAQDKFWEWVATWGCVLTHPKELGFEDDRYDLPELEINEIIVDSDDLRIDIFTGEYILDNSSKTLSERRNARKSTIDIRTDYTADLVNKSSDYWLVWCDLNDESKTLSNKIIDSVEIKGSDKNKHKVESMLGFQKEKIKCLVTKPKIAGFGMNWQHCNNIVFTGLSDSFEQIYQAIRRCWRFGQQRKVNVYFVISHKEGTVLKNIKRKEKQANEMIKKMVGMTNKYMKKNILENKEDNSEDHLYTYDMILPDFI